MILLKRPPNDEFTLRLFFNFSSKIKEEHDSIYLWSLILDPNWNQVEDHVYLNKVYSFQRDFKTLLDTSPQKELILLGIKDHLTAGEFNPWDEDCPNLIRSVIDLITKHDDKKFILLTSLENLDSYITLPNVKTIVPWGGDITNQSFQYKKLNLNIEKNFDSKYSYLSLNRNKRPNRLFLLDLLFALGIENTGLISCIFKDDIRYHFNHYNWRFNDTQLESFFEKGEKKLYQYNFPITDSVNIYKNLDNDNVENLKKTLFRYYQNTFVELICETSYTEKCFLITEKTQNSIFGKNFPIWISSKGTVQFLRDMGIDVFDDIIDHSYDLIEDPITRIYTAVTSNMKLLTNLNLIKSLWKNNVHRFDQNIKFIQNDMYRFYHDRTMNYEF